MYSNLEDGGWYLWDSRYMYSNLEGTSWYVWEANYMWYFDVDHWLLPLEKPVTCTPASRTLAGALGKPVTCTPTWRTLAGTAGTANYGNLPQSRVFLLLCKICFSYIFFHANIVKI
jgi:hypothetical protein